jgi:hypothetical protein
MQPIQVPRGFHLERRGRCAPRGDVRPSIRDDAGHVLAVVDIWLPDGDQVERVELVDRPD